MTDNDVRRQRELLAAAKKQLALLNKEFRRAASTVKDPVQRARLTDAYTDLVHRSVAKLRSGPHSPSIATVPLNKSADDHTRKSRLSGKAIAALSLLVGAAVGAVHAIRRSHRKQVTMILPEPTQPSSDTLVDSPATGTADSAAI